MKKRTKAKIVSFTAAFLVVLGGWLLSSNLMLDRTKTELEYNYRRALNDLTDYVTNMQTTLTKASLVNTAPMRASVSAKLLEQSEGAKAAMAILPFSQEKTDRISRFLSQIGDYAMALNWKSTSGGKVEESDLQNLSSMGDYAGRLSEALQEIQANLDTEKASIGRTESLLNNVDEIDALPSFDDGLDGVAQEFSEFPSLLYDGPFSDHILRRESLFLKDKAELTREEAAKKAAEFLCCDPLQLEDGGTNENALAAYVFTYESARVSVTRRGGEISYFKKTGEIPEAKLTYEEALAEATEFLKDCGISSFKESYYVMNDNMCTINFCSVTEDDLQAVCYPDLIKVVVELREGGTVEYDAAGYLMNHRERQLSPPALSAAEAQENLSPLLTVDGLTLSVIPTPGLDEVLCWEFRCTTPDGGEALVYLNAETGLEEQFYLLQKGDNGVLVV